VLLEDFERMFSSKLHPVPRTVYPGVMLSGWSQGPGCRPGWVPCSQVEVCCFDKTGTLTSDHLLLEEVVAPEGETQKRAAHKVMATCHSLVQVGGWVQCCSIHAVCCINNAMQQRMVQPHHRTAECWHCITSS
jgi:hypothetical protein